MAGYLGESNPSVPALLESTNPSIASDTVDIVAVKFEETWRPMLQEVWEEGIVSDMILSVSGKEFSVHRLVMLIYSTTLRRKIALADPRRTPLEVNLDLDATLMKKALEFMYQGRVEVARNQLQPLAQLARDLGITALSKRLLLEELKGTEVTVQNCLSVWEKASKAEHEELTKTAKAVSLANFATLQHSGPFKSLSALLVKEYLCSDDLVTHRPEERLLAALHWVQVDLPSRHRHLCPMLDSLPLVEMAWFLDHALNLPLIQGSCEARRKIEQAKEQVAGNNVKEPSEKYEESQDTDVSKPKVEDPTKPRKPQLPRRNALVRESHTPHLYLVLTGHKFQTNIKNEVVAVDLERDFECVQLGRIEAQFDRGTNCCMLAGNLYVSNLGPDRKEMWTFNLHERSASLLVRLRTPRRHHGMTAHHSDQVYIVGGDEPSVSSLSCVETVDPKALFPAYKAGSLKHSDIKWNVRCCELEGGDLAVVGARTSRGDTVLEVWSPSTASTTTIISLGQDVGQVWGMVHTDSHIIVVARQVTVVCGLETILNRSVTNKLKDIFSSRTHKPTVSDKYKSPNQGCAVVLTPPGYLVLVGGEHSGEGSQLEAQCVYRAPVTDVISNTGPGWQPVNTKCRLKGSFIYGYDSTVMALQQ